MPLITTPHKKLLLAAALLGLAITGGYAAYQASAANAAPDFGSNVLILDPAMPAGVIQNKLDEIFTQQESNQFGSQRYAVLFKPGIYNNTIRVGFYTHLMGLGATPDAVTINGGLRVDAGWFHNDATQNFWRVVENLAVVPANGTMQWAVAQASPMRRVHIRGNMLLDDDGWSSGGFIADSVIDQQINSGNQQQWLTRNSRIGSWLNSNWNMVFVGTENPPSAAGWPKPSYTVIEQTPLVREKPFLTVDKDGDYSVFVPDLRTNSAGPSWTNGAAAGQSIPIRKFYIAKAGVDTAASINQALAKGKHLLLTPGIYQLDAPLHVTTANTVVLGLGLATLQPVSGQPAMLVDDADGIKLAGILFDAGVKDSPVLLQLGAAGSHKRHAENPASMHDLFFRVGGAGPGNAATSLEINSHDVIGDDLWIWRADHGTGVDWGTNKTTHGIVVNGDNVTIYGLAVEHYHQYQTVWNGNGGRVYFYQSEIPYDVPDQTSWMNGKVNGYASYKLADSVTNHQAWGVGIYCYFDTNPKVKLHSAIELPEGKPGIQFHDVTTVSLGGVGEITHVINDKGEAANEINNVVRFKKY